MLLWVELFVAVVNFSLFGTKNREQIHTSFDEQIFLKTNFLEGKTQTGL